MTETMVTYDTSEQPAQNGTPSAFVDNRVQLVVDPKQIETWELMVLENAKIADWLLVFARYLCRGDKPVSPEIPNKPIDELSKGELAQIRNSEAFKLMKHYKAQELRAAVKAFSDQATAGF